MNAEAQAKHDVVDELRDRLGRANVAILTIPRGLNVAQVTKLRRKMRELSAEYKVAKNTLASRAVGDTSFAPLRPLLKGPTALVFGYGDREQARAPALEHAVLARIDLCRPAVVTELRYETAVDELVDAMRDGSDPLQRWQELGQIGPRLQDRVLIDFARREIRGVQIGRAAEPRQPPRTGSQP